MMLAVLFSATIWLAGDEPLSRDDAPPAVAAYLKLSESQRPQQLAQMKDLLRQRSKSNRRLTAAEKQVKAVEVKAIKAAISRLENTAEFCRPTMAPGILRDGYCGRIQLLEFIGGEQTTAIARIKQIVDETNLIVEAGAHDYWIQGMSTKGLADGNRFRLAGAWHVNGSKTYETVLGGSKTVLVLEIFNEDDALTYLARPQRDSLKKQLESEDNK